MRMIVSNRRGGCIQDEARNSKSPNALVLWPCPRTAKKLSPCEIQGEHSHLLRGLLERRPALLGSRVNVLLHLVHLSALLAHVFSARGDALFCPLHVPAGANCIVIYPNRGVIDSI